MTTGARRGELCGLRWCNVDLDNGTIILRTSIAQDGARRWEKDTKTHQQRRVAIDPDTVEVLRMHLARCEEQAAAFDLALGSEAFVFSLDADHGSHLVPSSVSQRYRKLAMRLGLNSHLHQLRHYSATELIAAGVDVRTVAGRLGHSGGGTTTLRVYAAWKAEADQRAASALGSRLPGETPPGVAAAKPRALSPYEFIAAELRTAIKEGKLRPGDRTPTVDELASRNDVSVGTAHRALALIKAEGLIATNPRPTLGRTRPGARANVRSGLLLASDDDPSPKGRSSAVRTYPWQSRLVTGATDRRHLDRGPKTTDSAEMRTLR